LLFFFPLSCETHFTTYQQFVANKSAISSFLGSGRGRRQPRPRRSWPMGVKAGLGFVWNELAYLVESSLQGISLNSLLWKRNKLLVVIQTWSPRVKPAASVHGCGKQTPSASILFSVRICYMFLISKCNGKSDLGLCMSSEFVKGMPLRSADFWFRNVFGCKIRRKSALRSGILFASPEVMHRARFHFPLHFDKVNI